MKKLFLVTAATIALFAGAADAQAIFGSGSQSQAGSELSSFGDNVSGAGSIGNGAALSSNVQTSVGTAESAAFNLSGTNIANSGSVSGSTTNTNYGSGNTSFSGSLGQAGGLAFGSGGSNMGAGSNASGFAGFGVNLP